MAVIETVNVIKSGKLSATEHLESCLQKADQKKELNAFLNLLRDRARNKARDIDARIKQDQPVGGLAGSVIAIKDNINIKNEITTCASKILAPFRSPYNATVIEKLEEADAVIIGKTNMDEFAMGSSNENSAFGSVKNPHDPTKISGGSSGGSAVSVAAGIVDAALGSDTGGSIRQPAGLTGTVGIKPSYGRVSRYGLVAFASSLDQIGVFSSSVKDTAFVLQHIAGYDKNDSTSANAEVPNYISDLIDDVKGMRIGLPKEYFSQGLDPEIKDGILKIVNELQNQSAEIVDIQLPMSEYAIAMYYIIATAEASSNLARYDGVRYGIRKGEKNGLIDMYGETRSDGFGDEVRRRIILGTYVLSAGYYDAYYKKALQVRRLLKNDFDKAFEKCDVIVSPTSPTTAYSLGEKIEDPLAMYLDDIYTVSANLTGICGMSVPAGFHSNGLPFGIQLQARAFNENALFHLGNCIEHNVKTGQK